MNHDSDKYLACMEELKRRFAVLDEALAPFRDRNLVAVPNLELACLQLRKIYELVAFAALATNRERYSEVRKAYEKDWNLAEVLKVIEKLNPHSFPIAYKDVDGEIFDIPELKFTRASLTKLHGELGSVLHARNPYAPEIDFRSRLDKCCQERDRARTILNFHRVWPDPHRDQTFYLVQMHTLPDGAVQVAVFEKQAAVQ